MPKLNLRTALRIKGAAGEVLRLKGQGFVWSPDYEAQFRALFAGGLGAGGLPGLMIDPYTQANNYQDSARTTLVNALGQPIGSTTDLSGNNNHPTQATSTSRALYQGYADFDGTDDGWQTPAIDFTGSDEITLIASYRKNSDATVQCVAELGPNNNTTNGTCGLYGPALGSDRAEVLLGVRGTTTRTVGYLDPSVAAPVTMVVACVAKISTDTADLYINGVLRATNALDLGAGNFTSQVLNIGRRNNLLIPADMHLYRLGAIGKALTDSERAIGEAWANEPVGVM